MRVGRGLAKWKILSSSVAQPEITPLLKSFERPSAATEVCSQTCGENPRAAEPNLTGKEEDGDSKEIGSPSRKRPHHEPPVSRSCAITCICHLFFVNEFLLKHTYIITPRESNTVTVWETPLKWTSAAVHTLWSRKNPLLRYMWSHFFSVLHTGAENASRTDALQGRLRRD